MSLPDARIRVTSPVVHCRQQRSATKTATDKSIVISCGSCSLPGAEGLTCRINKTLNVKAEWDEERSLLCCKAPEDLCVPDLSYEVLDSSGNVVCRSTGDCSKGASSQVSAPDDVQQCDKPYLLQSDGKIDLSSTAGVDAVEGPPGGDPAASSASTGSVLAGLSWLDRLLPVWIIAAMVLGVLLGYFVPQVSTALAVAHIGEVSLPIALGLWLMMWPVLTKVRYELLGVLMRDKAVAKQFAVSFALNWLLGPALMTGLAWACLPDLPGFRNGVIMVGLARCIAMVLLWNDMARGNPELCAVMVAFNSVLQIVLYAPLALLYLQVLSGASGVTVGFWPIAKSVLLFLGVPLVAGILLRCALLAVKSKEWFEKSFMPYFGPLALVGLLYTIVILFASQGSNIIQQIGNVARVSVPMLLYFNLMFFLSLAISYKLRMSYEFSVTQAFTAASNNFELAIAVAVGAFGVHSQEALAATVGPLIEVPVLLALVYFALWIEGKVNWTRGRSIDQGLKPISCN